MPVAPGFTADSTLQLRSEAESAYLNKREADAKRKSLINNMRREGCVRD